MFFLFVPVYGVYYPKSHWSVTFVHATVSTNEVGGMSEVITDLPLVLV